MSLRVVGYAINGRGMGHLARQLAILRWVVRLGAAANVKVEPWLLTSSEADTLSRREGIPALKIPSKSMMRDAGLEPARYLAIARAWVLNAVAGLQPDVLVVDTFPAGSFGELVSALELARRRVLVAREVRDEVKDAAWQAMLPLYDRVVVPGEGKAPILLRSPEELLPRDEARAALGIPADARAVWITVGGGGDAAADSLLPRLVDAALAAGWHAVVAAGPLYDGPERRGPGITWLERYASAELLPGVDAALSAGGYNSVHELWAARVPTVFLPQPRLADDQALRVERACAAGLGVVAPSVEAAVGLLDGLTVSPALPAVENGAAAAAEAVLSLCVDPRDVAAARAAWSPAVVAATRASGMSAAEAQALVRLFGGGSRRKASGGPAEEADPAAFLATCRAVGLPASTGVAIARVLAQRFPVATPREVADALATLLPAWSGWEDWLGVQALLRGLPAQRELTLPRFVGEVRGWAGELDDPYEALRRLHRATTGRPLAEVLGRVSEDG